MGQCPLLRFRKKQQKSIKLGSAEASFVKSTRAYEEFLKHSLTLRVLDTLYRKLLTRYTPDKIQRKILGTNISSIIYMAKIYGDLLVLRIQTVEKLRFHIYVPVTTQKES